VRLLIIDDHSVARRGLQTLAEGALDITAVAHAGNEQEALAALNDLPTDLIALDLRIPGVDPARLCEQLHARCPEAKIVVFTAFEDLASIRACIAAGARGCVLKDATDTDVGATLRRVLAGEIVFDPRIADDMARDYTASLQGNTPNLTERELEVLRLLQDGLSNRAIAARLHLAESTVKGHVAALLEKLGVESRLQAVVHAHREGLDG
jgi:two-component system, NarL family, nitrate/nitrite response regulator NarL